MSKRYPSPFIHLSKEEYAALPQDVRDRAVLDARKWKAERTMKLVDSWPKPLREVAHELGPTIVEAFTNVGIRDPRNIRHLVALCRNQQIDGNPAAFGNARSPGWKATTRHHEDKTLGLPAKYKAGATPLQNPKGTDR